VVWGLLEYILVGGVIVVSAWSQATWGGPAFGPMLVGLLAMVASAAVGYTAGYCLPSRFTPPLVAVGLFVTQGLASSAHAWYSFLAPEAHGELSVWGITPDLSWPQSLFLLGLAGMALGILALAVRRDLFSGGVLLAAILLTGIGAELVHRNVPWDFFRQPMSLSEIPITRITPSCTPSALAVCVHPGYRAQLSRIATTINRIAAPVVGLPGAPTRAIDDDVVVANDNGILMKAGSPSQAAQLRWDGLFVFDTPPAQTIVFDPWHAVHFPANIALDLVSPGLVKGPPSDAQEAIARWLVRRAGFSPDLSLSNPTFDTKYPPGVPTAEHRFAALAPSQQRAWLHAHFSRLRSGQLGLRDPP